jgi:hypothetical protein
LSKHLQPILQLHSYNVLTIRPKWLTAFGSENLVLSYVRLQSTVPKAAPEAKHQKPPGGLMAAAAAGTTAAAAGSAAAGGAAAAGAAGGAGAGATAGYSSQYEAIIKARPEFASLGPLFKSCAPVR